MPLGLPTPMFLVFAATVLAGSIGAIHYVIFHVLLDRPFRELTPPGVAVEDDDEGGRGTAGGSGDDVASPESGDGRG